METVYQWCLIVGGIMLVLSALACCLDGLDGALDGAFDAIHFDTVFIPMSGLSLTSGVALFGAVGLTTNNMIISAISGYILAVIMNIGAKKLKAVSNVSADKNQLFLYTGTLVSPIVDGDGGCVMFQLSTGSRVKYACKLKDSKDRVEAGTEVKLVEFDNNMAVVRLAKELENKYKDCEE